MLSRRVSPLTTGQDDDGPSPNPDRRRCRPALELLESRLLLSTGHASASSLKADAVAALSAGTASPTSQVEPIGRVATVTAGADILDFTGDQATSAPPEDLSGAQPMPDAQSLQVEGQNSFDRPSTLYRIPIDMTTRSLSVEVRSSEMSRSIQEQVSLIDESGHTLFSVVPHEGMSSIRVDVTPMLKGTPPHVHSLYLKVAWLPPASSTGIGVGYAPTTGTGGTASDPQYTSTSLNTSQADRFTIAVTRESAPLSPWQTIPSESSSASSTPETLLPVPVTTPPSATTSSAIVAEVMDRVSPPAAMVSAPRSVTSSALPTLGAAPLGGVLSLGGPTTRVKRTEGEIPDLALFDFEAVPLAVAPARGRKVSDAPGETASELVRLRGTGGFPLMGSMMARAGSPGLAPGTAHLATVDPNSTESERPLEATETPPDSADVHELALSLLEETPEAEDQGSPNALGGTIALAPGLTLWVLPTSWLLLPEVTDRARRNQSRRVTRVRKRENPAG